MRVSSRKDVPAAATTEAKPAQAPRTKAQRAKASPADSSERTRPAREAKPASSTPSTSLPAWVALDSMRLVNAVVLGSRGAGVEKCGFNATFMNAGGQMLSVHQPPLLPDVTSFEPPKPAFVNVIPGRSEPIDLRTPDGRPALSVEIKLADVAPQMTKFLAGFKPSNQGYEGGIVAFLLDRAGQLANAQLGTLEAQNAKLHQGASAYDKGDLAKARATLEPLLGSGFADARARAGYFLGEIAMREQDYAAAIQHLEQAKYGASAGLLVRIDLSLSNVHRAQRQFDKALASATAAAARADELPSDPNNTLRSAAYFQKAVMEKNLGRYAEASASMMGAMWMRDGHVPTMLAAAGYLCLAGSPAEGDALFARIPVPSGEAIATVDYGMNAAWFNAVKGDDAAALQWLGRAASAARKNNVASFLGQYMASEVDFDRLRDKPEFQTIAASLRRA